MSVEKCLQEINTGKHLLVMLEEVREKSKGTEYEDVYCYQGSLGRIIGQMNSRMDDLRVKLATLRGE